MDHNRPAGHHTRHHIWQNFGQHEHGLRRQFSLAVIVYYCTRFLRHVKGLGKTVSILYRLRHIVDVMLTDYSTFVRKIQVE